MCKKYCRVFIMVILLIREERLEDGQLMRIAVGFVILEVGNSRGERVGR